MPRCVDMHIHHLIFQPLSFPLAAQCRDSVGGYLLLLFAVSTVRQKLDVRCFLSLRPIAMGVRWMGI